MIFFGGGLATGNVFNFSTQLHGYQFVLARVQNVKIPNVHHQHVVNNNEVMGSIVDSN